MYAIKNRKLEFSDWASTSPSRAISTFLRVPARRSSKPKLTSLNCCVVSQIWVRAEFCFNGPSCDLQLRAPKDPYSWSRDPQMHR